MKLVGAPKSSRIEPTDYMQCTIRERRYENHRLFRADYTFFRGPDLSGDFGTAIEVPVSNPIEPFALAMTLYNTTSLIVVRYIIIDTMIVICAGAYIILHGLGYYYPVRGRDVD